MIDNVVFSLWGNRDLDSVIASLWQRGYHTKFVWREYDLGSFEWNPHNTVFIGGDLAKVQQAKEIGFLTCLVHADADSPEKGYTGFDMEVTDPEGILSVLKTRVDVREATVDDLDDMLRVAQSAMPSEYSGETLERDQRFYREYIDSWFSALYVAELGGEMVGYVNYNPRMLTGSFELMQIGVHEDHQRKGIGSALILQSRADYIRKMVAKGIPVFTVLLTTTGDNEAGQTLYQRLNFRINGEIENAYVGLGNREISLGFVFDPTLRYEGEYATHKESG